ncbi:MAG TPA: hypothetical protein VG498_23960 [Terriglobales bacterium]|nr:hypothetical protein [Terriglobales bacterium]
MNDRIRNALQAIECITYAADPSAAKSLREAVEVIDGVLREFVSDSTIAPQQSVSIKPDKASQDLREKVS